MDEDILGRNDEQEYDGYLLELMEERKIVPVAETKDSNVRLFSGDKDITDELYKEHLYGGYVDGMIDGFDVEKPGNPAHVILYPSDLNQHLGGCVLVYRGNWVLWCWDPRCGLTGDE